MSSFDLTVSQDRVDYGVGQWRYHMAVKYGYWKYKMNLFLEMMGSLRIKCLITDDAGESLRCAGSRLTGRPKSS